MNKFLINKMDAALEGISSKLYKNAVAAQFFVFNSFEISNDDELKKYHYLSQYVPIFVKRVFGSYDKQMINKIIKYAMKSIDVNFTENDIKEIVSQSFPKLNLIKIAYPNLGGDIEPLKNYDINKWITALNDIYVRTRIYGSRRDAINQVTQNWDDMDEKLDFERWARFYEQGGARMYKMAQGYPMLPIQAIPGLTPKNNENFIPQEAPAGQDQKVKTNKNIRSLDDVRRKIVARINSVEKLLLDFSKMFPNENQYDKLLSTLLGLKQDVFRLKTAALLEDVIYRAKNSLEKKGVNEEMMNLFIKVAQLPPLPTDASGTGGNSSVAPVATEQPTDPANGAKAADGFVEGLRKLNPKIPEMKFEEKATTPAAIQDAATQTDGEQATTKTMSNVAPGTPATSTQQKTSAAKFNWANINTPELQKFEKIANNLFEIIKPAKHYFYITAQDVAPTAAAPAQANPVTAPVPEAATQDVAEEAPVEKKRPKPGEGPIKSEKSPRDAALLNIENDVLENALNNITINDVIIRMEALARVFKNREIARQLAIIDIMLDKLGIAGFFPALAEATRSALESNQYCQTRVEEVLSKLTSAADAKGDSLIGPNAIPEKGNSIVDREMDSYMKEKPEGKVQEMPAQTPAVAPASAPAAV